MLQKFLLTVVCFAAVQAFATVRTVSNNPTNLAQYNTIQEAIDVSSTGDTVYVHGSPYNYTAFTITSKKITLIGPGFAPNKDLPLRATVGGFAISGTASQGSVIMGMRFFGYDVQMSINDVNGVSFIRNSFGTSSLPYPGTVKFSSATNFNFQNMLFEGNVFDACTIFIEAGNKSLSNSLFRNNYFFFNGSYYDNGMIRGFVNGSNVLFDHNLFMGPVPGPMNLFVEGCRFLHLSNNIFVGFNIGTTGLSYSLFNNNLSFNTPANTPWNVQ